MAGIFTEQDVGNIFLGYTYDSQWFFAIPITTESVHTFELRYAAEHESWMLAHLEDKDIESDLLAQAQILLLIGVSSFRPVMDTFAEMFEILAEMPMKLPTWKDDDKSEAIASERWYRQAICAMQEADVLMLVADPTDPVEELIQDEVYDCLKGMRDDLIQRRVDDLIIAESKVTS